jgi:hypothetical protein
VSSDISSKRFGYQQGSDFATHFSCRVAQS